MNDQGNTPVREWWTRPGVVLPVVGSIVLIVALFTPQAASGRFGDPRLSSHLTSALGARVLHDMASRLGWRTVRRDSVPAPVSFDGRTIHAVLAPVTPVLSAEAHAYLQAVRGGDALLLVLEGRTPLSDSLGVTHSTRGGVLPSIGAAEPSCAARRVLAPPLWPDARVHLLGLRWLKGVPADRVGFAPLQVEAFGSPHPGDAAAGFSLGRGRVVVVADPDLLRNDVLRHCRWGADTIAVRMLEWLRAGGPVPRTTLVFDEYHQGFGSRPGVAGVTTEFLLSHPVGRTVLAAVFAALVLLLAAASRAIRPAEVVRVERRDPLEQVDALAHAYEQVHATRTISARLLRGVRRRVDRGSPAGIARADDQFLERTAERNPALAGDVGVVRRALHETIPDRDLTAVGAALRRIEQTLTTTIS
ncbi:hypothetical protein BH11GEM1_BH11GEM1_11640 [soil metagenome]